MRGAAFPRRFVAKNSFPFQHLEVLCPMDVRFFVRLSIYHNGNSTEMMSTRQILLQIIT